MSHLSDEQFEVILQGGTDESGHLEQCAECRGRLEEKRQICQRLRDAFSPVKASDELSSKISRQLVQAGEVTHKRHVRLWVGSAVAAVAAMIVLVPMLAYFAGPPPVIAAQEELANIHEHNISGSHSFYSDSDPDKLAAYFKEKLGFDISMPKSDQGLSLRGCCVRHFRETIAGSYVVETDAGVMSIVVVTDKPKSLGMGQKYEHNGEALWKSEFAKCKMVTVRIGDYSYCAVGEISHDYLEDLLLKLLPEKE